MRGSECVAHATIVCNGYEIIGTELNYGAAERCRTGSANCVREYVINAKRRAKAERNRTGSAICNFTKAGIRIVKDALLDGRRTTNDNEE